MGTQNFRIVVIDSVVEDGKPLKVGLYICAAEDKQVVLNEESIRQWLDKGAIPSDTVKDSQ